MKQFALTVLFIVVVILVSFLLFGVPIGEGFKLLYEGSVGDKVAISQSLVRATPVLLTATGITIAWHVGQVHPSHWAWILWLRAYDDHGRHRRRGLVRTCRDSVS